MKEPRGLIFAFIACALIWGSTFLAIRIGNDSMPPIWACTLRLILAAIILNILLLVTRQPFPKDAALKAAALYGLFEFGLQFPLLYWGESMVPSGLAAVLYAICPITAIFAAKALGMENWNLPKLGAACLAFAGVAVIFWREVLHGIPTSGFLAITLAAWLAPIAALMLQRGPKQGAIGANAVGALVGVPLSLVASLAVGESHRFPTTIAEAAPIVYLAIMSSVIAFGLFAWLVNYWKTTTVTFLGVIVPVIAVVLGALVRNERLASGAWIGAVIVLIGVVLALRLESTSKPAPLAETG